MKVSSINSMSFGGKIKRGQITDKTTEEIKKQKAKQVQNNNGKNYETKIPTNVVGIGATGSTISTMIILFPVADKSI